MAKWVARNEAEPVALQKDLGCGKMIRQGVFPGFRGKGQKQGRSQQKEQEQGARQFRNPPGAEVGDGEGELRVAPPCGGSCQKQDAEKGEEWRVEKVSGGEGENRIAGYPGPDAEGYEEFPTER